MKLIFVYNAKSGLGNHILDGLHKTFSPKTYDCDLCSLTYGHIGPRKEWKEFLASVKMESEFHYKDTFAKNQPGLKDDFPVIYTLDNNYKLLVSSEEMKECKDVGLLIDKIRQNLTRIA